LTGDNRDDVLRNHHDGGGREASDHPPESMLAGYLDGHLTESERAEVELHLDQCGECRDAVAETVAVLDGPDVSFGKRGGQPARRRDRRFLYVAAGALLAASVAIIVVRQFRLADSDVDAGTRTRDAAPPTLEDRIAPLAAVAPRDGSTQVGPQPRFTWRSASVNRYGFRLLAADGAPVWSHETSDTSVTLPPDVRLERGRSYFWRVDALATGIVASTRAQQFTVSP
jgi:anti-sigma factor RsiW